MMIISVECECGEVFEMEVSDETYRSVGHYRDSLMGKLHCPNPDCDKTIYAQANVYSVVEPDEDEQNPNIDWEDVEEGDRITYTGNPFEVALKHVWKSKGEDDREQLANLLFLRSAILEKNLILEVRESGFMSVFKEPGIEESAEEKHMWSEEDIESIKKNR